MGNRHKLQERQRQVTGERQVCDLPLWGWEGLQRQELTLSQGGTCVRNRFLETAGRGVGPGPRMMGAGPPWQLKEWLSCGVAYPKPSRRC